MLRVALRQIPGDKGKATYMEKAAEELVKAAAAGDVVAIKELADRIDGKAVAKVEVKHEHDFSSFLESIALGIGSPDLPALGNEPGELRH